MRFYTSMFSLSKPSVLAQVRIIATQREMGGNRMSMLFRIMMHLMQKKLNGNTTNLCYSSWTEVTVDRIPQGIWPTLFLIYINDLIDCCEQCDIYLFAVSEDSKIYRNVSAAIALQGLAILLQHLHLQ